MIAVFIWDTPNGRIIQEVNLQIDQPPASFFFTHPENVEEIKKMIPKLTEDVQLKRTEQDPKKLLKELDDMMKKFWKDKDNFK